MTKTTYRCGECGQTSQHPATDDTPVCNDTDDCGLLFDDEIVRTPAPSKRALKFSLIGNPEDYIVGDERPYDVLHRGVHIGIVEKGWAPHAHVPGELVEGWDFGDGEGRHGFGRTRAAAVLVAYAD